MYTKTIKLSVLLFAVLLISGTFNDSYAQHQDNHTFGIRAGLSVADFWGDDVGGTDVNTGFTGSIYYTYFASPYFAIQPELSFTRKGAEVSRGYGLTDGNANYHLGYLELPVLARFNIPNPSGVIPHLHTGPLLGLKLYGEENGTDLAGRHEDFEFGWVFGGGVDIVTTSDPNAFIRKFNIDLRYSLGLTDVYDVPGSPEAKNGVFAITAGFGF